MKSILITALTVVAVAGVVLFSSRCSLEQKMEDYQRSVVVSNPVLAGIPDGVYTGRARNGVVSVKVRVTVENHEILKIDLLRHFNGQGKPAEKILDDVVKAQSVQVDLISGASYSSKVILKAIEDALRQTRSL